MEVQAPNICHCTSIATEQTFYRRKTPVSSFNISLVDKQINITEKKNFMKKLVKLYVLFIKHSIAKKFTLDRNKILSIKSVPAKNFYTANKLSKAEN